MSRFRWRFVVSALVLSACVTTDPEGDRVKSIASNEDAAQYNMQLGVDYLQRGKLELAKDKLERALEQDPKLPQAHTAMALLYEQLGQADRADKHYRQALSLSTDAAMHNNYGVFLCRQGKREKAEEHFLEAIGDRLYATPEAALTNLGFCLRQDGEFERAEEYFRQALRRDPRFPDALWQMANVAYEQGNYLQARAFLQRYAEKASEGSSALWLGMLIEQELEDDAAVEDYEQRLKRDYPESVHTRQLLEQERDGKR